MNRAEAYSNKLIYQREVERLQKIHRKKLKNMRSTNKTNSISLMDNRPPQRFKHLELNLKKRQLEEDRYLQIERENKLLMQKMFSIMKQKPAPDSLEYQPGVRLSSSQQPRVDNYLSTCSMIPGQARLIPSLNREKRRRSYNRIMAENVKILARISSKKPVYKKRNWDGERKQTESYLANIGKDLTAGYLPQGPDGHSVYYDPSALSPSARLPRLRKSGTLSRSGRRSRTPSRRSKSRGSSRGGSRRMQRAQTAPATRQEGGLDGASAGVTLLENVRPLHDGRGGEAVLVVTELPSVAGPDGAVQLCATGVRVVASVNHGGGATLQLSLQEVKEIASGSQEADALTAALDKCAHVEGPHFVRPSTRLDGVEMEALGRAVCRRVEVVPSKSGFSLAVNDAEADHGEGGEPLSSPAATDSGTAIAAAGEGAPES